jgi:hypothetical protein
MIAGPTRDGGVAAGRFPVIIEDGDRPDGD